jgi:hypothetical protein
LIAGGAAFYVRAQHVEDRLHWLERIEMHVPVTALVDFQRKQADVGTDIETVSPGDNLRPFEK